ncbi:MAG: Uma2 family endonuclease [Lachnospiraceae bacterium]|nr:Uma2 family endonuclease [Lachnospiraceae bacterium]
MPLPAETTYTIQDIYALPEGQRAELIDGVLYDMAPPSRIHQKIVSQLTQILGRYISDHQGTCEVYPAPFAVFLHADDHVYVEPDVSVICNKDKLTEQGCEGAPDLIFEIVSPSSRRMDYSTKMTLYSNAGVREYWIIDPARERTTVYYFEEDAAPIIIPFDHPAQVGMYKDLEITISSLLK